MTRILEFVNGHTANSMIKSKEGLFHFELFRKKHTSVLLQELICFGTYQEILIYCYLQVDE